MSAAIPPAPYEAGAAISPQDIAPLGDTALVVRVGHQIDEATRRRVLSVVRALESAKLPGSAEMVPGFTTVTVHYDPTRLGWQPDASPAPYDVMHRHVAGALARLASVVAGDGNRVEIPVCYGGVFGPDLDHVAAHAGLSAQEVVARHAAGEYRVHLVGFLPGFPYLGGLDPHLATPRRDTPRIAVPAGSVGIGGLQTGVYPLESPGGWQLIGRSPLVLFDPLRVPPTLLVPGDVVRFRAIELSEYDHLRGTTE